MQFTLFVARRFFKNIGADRHSASNPTIVIATLGVAMGLLVMIASVSIILGFKSEITHKVESFGSHIEIMDVSSLTAPDAFPIPADRAFLTAVRRIPGVQSVNCIAQKMGILKTSSDFLGVTFKGLPADYDLTALRKSLVEGRMPDLTTDNGNEILISRRQADALGLSVGDRVFSYFFEESIKARRFKVVGIYSSNMSLFDKNVVLGSISTIRRLNRWDEGRASSIEVRLTSLNLLDETMHELRALCRKMNVLPSEQTRLPVSIKEHYMQVFSWLDLLDFNMVIILVLMLVVAGFTMISGLFILILERTQTIGVLKALGATNTRIRHIFLTFAAFITMRGLLLGNVLALVLLFAQQRWGLVHLNPATYYVETVPVQLNLWAILAVNALTLVLTVLSLVAPSYMISRVQPAKAIRFD